MAKIWPVYEGREPTQGNAWATIPLEEAIELLGLQPESYLGGPDASPKFGNVNQDGQPFGYKHIIVEVDRTEAKRQHWNAGFYRAKPKPPEVFELLLRQAAVRELGASNVLRVFSEPAIDSHGQEALRVTVVIANETTGRVANNSVLNAVVGLRERLREMRDERVPIIEYATEDELKLNVDH